MGRGHIQSHTVLITDPLELTMVMCFILLVNKEKAQTMTEKWIIARSSRSAGAEQTRRDAAQCQAGCAHRSQAPFCSVPTTKHGLFSISWAVSGE